MASPFRPIAMDALRRSLEAEGAVPEAAANDAAVGNALAAPKAKRAKVPEKAPPADRGWPLSACAKSHTKV